MAMPRRRRPGSAGDLAPPAHGWTPLFNGGRRRNALPLPVHPSVEQSGRTTREMPIGCVILEEIMQYSLSNLRAIHKSLRYWESRARGSDSQHIYFTVFQRDPRAFVEAARQGLAGLMGSGGGGGGGPSQTTVLDSAKDTISTNIAALTTMERCLAALLAELYREADMCKQELTRSGDDTSLRVLFAVLNRVFVKLEEELLRDQDGRNTSEFRFNRLPADVLGTESPHWTEELSARGISLIYRNLEELDNLVSSRLSSSRKPGNMTVYWLPYACGAIGLSACSLWLLRYSSFMGSPDMGNWIGHAKESLAGFWNEKPISSVGDEPFEPTSGRSLTGKQEARQAENLFGATRLKIQKHEPADISNSVLALDQAVKANILDLQEAILELGPILQATKLNLALLALGIPLVLLLSMRARAMHARHAEQRSRIARRLAAAEEKLLEFQECSNVGGKDDEACWKFGLALYSIDRLYEVVELYTDGRTEGWSNSFKEHIFHLAKPGLNEEDQRAVLSRLKDMLFTSPQSRGYRSILH